MADRFECDKCHNTFPSLADKKGRFLLEELGVWTDHPHRAPYKHEAFICAGCLGMLQSAVSKPHKQTAGQVQRRAIQGRGVGQPTPKEHCSDCGAAIQPDLSCTPGCAGMAGLAEAKRITGGLDIETAMGLLHAALSQAGKVMVYGLDTRIMNWLDAMRAKGHTALDDEPE